MSRSRAWAITINNYTNQDFIDWFEADSDYSIFGFEVGDSGTPHLQGYIYFNNPIRASTLKTLLPRAHTEIAKGSHKQNKLYCMGYHNGVLKADEENEWYEFGELPKQGRRTDMEGMVEAIKQGATDQELIDINPTIFVRYGKGLQAVRNTYMVDRTDPPTVLWIWGPTGCGKTKYATSLGEYYIKDHTQWWDGYTQQPTIVIDDFEGKWPFRDLLRLLDRYPYQGQIKGGYVKINSPTIIITCDRPPEAAMNTLKEHELSQLLRRITEVKCFGTEVLGTEVSGNTRHSLFLDEHFL